MNNFYIFVNQINQSPEFKKFDIRDNQIGFNGKYIDFTYFDFHDFYAKNPNFKNNLPNLNAEALFEILQIHAKFYDEENKKQEMTTEDFDNITKDNEILQKFHLIHNNKKVEGIVKNYIHYQDKSGKNYLLSDTNGEDVLKAYDALLLSRGQDFTEEELFAYLNSGKKSITLECLNDALMRNNATEEHLNNLKLLNDRNHAIGNTLDTPLGNDEEKIYISNGVIITFNLNKHNEYVKESHEVSEESKDVSIESSVQEEKIVEKEKIPLISFEEYSELIFKQSPYTEEEENKIKIFENYIFDVIVYKDYLIPEIYEYYTQFCKLTNYLYAIKDPTQNIIDTIKRYEDMFARSENVVLENVPEKVAKLIRTNPNLDKAGSTSTAIYITILIIVIGIFAAILLIK